MRHNRLRPEPSGTVEHQPNRSPSNPGQFNQLTDHGRRVAVLFTKTHGRVLGPGLVQLDPNLPTDIDNRSPLAQAWRKLDHTLDDYINRQIIAA